MDNETTFTISEIFKTNNITKLNYAFANLDRTNENSGYEYSQRVVFDGIFNNKYRGSAYANNTLNYYGAFMGYSKDYVEFSNMSLVNNQITRNYEMVGGLYPENK